MEYYPQSLKGLVMRYFIDESSQQSRDIIESSKESTDSLCFIKFVHPVSDMELSGGDVIDIFEWMGKD